MKKKGKKPFTRKDSYLEELLFPKLIQLSEELEVPHPKRNRTHLAPTALEFDFSWATHKIAIEIHGGIDKAGRRSGHVSRDGLRRDYYKCNLAQIHGWILLQFPPEYCKCPRHWRIASRLIKAAFKCQNQFQ